MSSKVTPRPWKVDMWLGSSDFLIAMDAGSRGAGIAIAETSPGTGCERANASHIVKCVNFHERLVEALSTVISSSTAQTYMLDDCERFEALLTELEKENSDA